MPLPRRIGSERRDAIDWTQDLLSTTRPVAEAVVAQVLAERRLVETAGGFFLLEDDDDMQTRHANVLHQSNRPFKGWSKVRVGLKGNAMRQNGQRVPTHTVVRQAASKYSPHATDMIEAHRLRVSDQADADDEEG